MKIILSQQETRSIMDTVRMLGGSMPVNNDNDVVKVSFTENGETEVRIVEGLVLDSMRLVCTMGPLIKGLFSHAKSTFTVLRTLGENLENKWGKYKEPVEEPAEVKAEQEVE